VADLLVASTDRDPSPTQLGDYDQWLDLALAARAESLDQLLGILDQLQDADDIDRAVRELDRSHGEQFHLLSSVVVGAYFMCPEVCDRIGYHGQRRAAPRTDEAFEDLADDILDVVIERGPIYVDPAQVLT
jgi:hypothetical protein